MKEQLLPEISKKIYFKSTLKVEFVSSFALCQFNFLKKFWITIWVAEIYFNKFLTTEV